MAAAAQGGSADGGRLAPADAGSACVRAGPSGGGAGVPGGGARSGGTGDTGGGGGGGVRTSGWPLPSAAGLRRRVFGGGAATGGTRGGWAAPEATTGGKTLPPSAVETGTVKIDAPTAVTTGAPPAGKTDSPPAAKTDASLATKTDAPATKTDAPPATEANAPPAAATVSAGSIEPPMAGKGGKDTAQDIDPLEEDAQAVTTAEALRFAWHWVLPRSRRLQLLVLGAMACELLCNACDFVQPLLLKFAMDGLTLSAGGGGRGSRPDAGADAGAVAGAAAGVSVALRLGAWTLQTDPIGRRPLIAIVGYMLTGYATGLLNYGQSLCWRRATQGMSYDVQVGTFAHLHSLSLMWHLNRHTSSVLNIMYFGVKAVTDLLGMLSFNIFPMVADFLLTLAVLSRLESVAVAVMAFLSVVVYGVFTAVLSYIRVRRLKERMKHDSRNAGRALESLFNYENVKTFGTEAVEVRRYASFLEKQNTRNNRSSLTGAALQHGQSLIRSLCVTTGLVVAGQRVMEGRLSISDFVAVQAYLGRLFSPMSYVASMYNRFASSFLALRKLVALHKLQPEVVDAPDATPLVLHPTPTSKGGRVAFEHVSFAYGKDSAGAIHDVSFEVPAGGTAALVGASGSGKTTLVRLLLRLFNVSAGRVTVDGQDVASVTQQSLREAIGVVAQDTNLMRDTIAHNIAYGRGGGEGVLDEAIESAADVAQLRDWIGRLPKGLSSVCGERGVRLSGGERQRVGIARVVIRQPAILLLDECSSSLDSETERAMQTALRAASRGTTTLVVAHRLSTIVAADQILVLHEGRLVEQGTHATLVRIEGGRYRRMWELQHPPVGAGIVDVDAGSADAGRTGEGLQAGAATGETATAMATATATAAAMAPGAAPSASHAAPTATNAAAAGGPVVMADAHGVFVAGAATTPGHTPGHSPGRTSGHSPGPVPGSVHQAEGATVTAADAVGTAGGTPGSALLAAAAAAAVAAEGVDAPAAPAGGTRRDA